MSDPVTQPSLKGRLALVTGASRGIGRAVALGLAEAGAELILVARTVGALEEVDDAVKALGGHASLVPLDLTDYDALDRLGALVFERWQKLDILIANAGMLGPLSPLGHIPPKDWDKLIATNLTANWRLIRSLDPLLKQSDAGRAVFVTSGAAHKNRPYWGGYAVTKAALETLVLTYAAECAQTEIKVNLINPGPVRTRMRAQAMPGEDPETLPHPSEIVPLIVDLARGDQVPAVMVSFKAWKAAQA